MKMRVRGVTLGDVTLGGGSSWGGTAIALNTECTILISHRNVIRGIL